jgi:RNA polymerase sigma-70 factor, ECF subfamily
MKPEQQLVEDAQKGCAESFAEIARVPALRFRGRAARAVGSADAEDVVQEALLLAFRKLHMFRGDSSFSSWFFTIGSNCIRMHLRTPYKKRFVISSDLVDSCLASKPYVDHHEDTQELRDTLRELGSLKESYRAPLVAALTHPCTLRVLAEKMGVEYSWLKTRLNRARTALRKALEDRESA